MENEALDKILTELEEIIKKEKLEIQERELFMEKLKINFKVIEAEIKEIWTVLTILKHKIQEIEKRITYG